LVFEFLLGTSETFLCSLSAPQGKTLPSARCASAANVVHRDVDVFGAKNVLIIFYNAPCIILIETLPSNDRTDTRTDIQNDVRDL
jgi:hypothetical protein